VSGPRSQPHVAAAVLMPDYGTAHSVSIVTGEWVPATCTPIDYYYINTQHYTVSQRKKQDTILLSVTSPNINRLFSLLDSVENV